MPDFGNLERGLVRAKKNISALTNALGAFRRTLAGPRSSPPPPRPGRMYWGVFCRNSHFIALWGAPSAFSGPRFSTMTNDPPLDYHPEDRIICPDCQELVRYPLAAEELKVMNSDKILRLYRPLGSD